LIYGRDLFTEAFIMFVRYHDKFWKQTHTYAFMVVVIVLLIDVHE
jgi:hypothetical protein